MPPRDGLVSVAHLTTSDLFLIPSVLANLKSKKYRIVERNIEKIKNEAYNTIRNI